MVNIDCVYIKTLSTASGDNPRASFLVAIKKTNFILNLWSPWHTIADYIRPFTSLKVYNAEEVSSDTGIFYSAGSSSIVVVDPDFLLNATSVNSVSFCPRSYYINEIIGDSPSPYIAIKGSIVHNCLSSALVSGSSPSEMLPDILDSFSLHFEYHGYSRDDVYQEVREMAECLDSFVSNLSAKALPEILFLSPYFGIRGRIDVFDPNKIYELKTGKVSADDDIRFSDLLQVTLYRFGLENILDNRKTDNGVVVYVGTNEKVLKTANPSWGLLRYGIEMRNLAYRITYQGYVPPILPENQHNKCRKCSVQHYCSLLCSGLEHQRNCSTCPHNDLCTKNTLPKRYQDYFNKFSQLIREEKAESANNLSDLWKLSVKQRVARGKAITDLVLENEINDKDKILLLFSCTNESELREGDIVLLSNGDVLSGSVSTGIISRISLHSVEVETRAKVHDVTTLDLYSIDVGFRRQQRGLFNILFKRNNFRDLIIEGKAPSITKVKGDYIENNFVQNEAIEKIVGTENYCLIQGPAGTGKTYVIAKAAITLASNGEKVLLTAFTNRAVDNICSYLIKMVFMIS